MPISTIGGAFYGVYSGAHWGAKFGYREPFSKRTLNMFALRKDLSNLEDGLFDQRETANQLKDLHHNK